MDNPALNLRLRWTDDSANLTVEIEAYRLAHAIMGMEEAADIKLVAGVKLLAERSCGWRISDDVARKIIEERLVALYIAGI